jgi:hypothetical protein
MWYNCGRFELDCPGQKNMKGQEMKQNTINGKAKNDKLKATYTAREIFACIPDWNQWRLLRKVPYTKQTYEVVGVSGAFYQMDELISYAAEKKQYKPVMRPSFVASKYLINHGRQIVYQDNA